MKNSTLLFLLILALAGDIVLAYLLYDCMHEHDKGLIIEDTSVPCTVIATTAKTSVMTDWANFNTLNGSTDENWGVICRDALLEIFKDTSVNALSFYMCADNDDPTKAHSYSVGIVGCKVVPGTAPGSGTVVTKDNATYYSPEPWCPPQCYVRSSR
jgi:hypothetical protein